MATRKELIEAVAHRYREASKSDKSKILDEFAELTNYHRKHAIRVLGSKPREPSQRPPAAIGYMTRRSANLSSYFGKPPIGCAESD